MLKSLKSLINKSHSAEKHPRQLVIRRISSEQIVTKENSNTAPVEETLSVSYQRSRASTFTNGISRPVLPSSRPTSKSSSHVPPNNCSEEKLMETLSQLTSPRHLQRRLAVCGEDNIGVPNKQADSNSVLIRFEEFTGKTTEDLAAVSSTHTLRDMVEMLMIKHDIEQDNLDDVDFVVSSPEGWNGDKPNGNLDHPVTMFAGHTVEFKLKEPLVLESTLTFKTVRDCLSYFDSHGLVDLPLSLKDDESYHFPRVPIIDSIVKEWSDLPLNPQQRDSLTKTEMEQQLAIWELIYTEYSHIKHLETIINVFMRCLELIRRTKLLSNESYHNVFGHMEEIYIAHDQFWTQTLEPVLETVYETGLPLDLNEMINRFPTDFAIHFEVYEQHCQLEALNLHSLKKARENPDFNAYLEWCEAQPECRRLGLDQLLAAPMQRLTRYPLLVAAIIKKTSCPRQKQRLDMLCEGMQEFLQCVNTGIRIQEETERVRNAMNRITGFQMGDVPNEIKELVQPHTHLDLLAPMTGVEVDRARVLMLEGSLKFRDGLTSAKIPLHLFLFTDMLLITKPSRNKEAKYTIIREPYKIDRLVLHSLEPGSFCAVVLNEFRVASSWFILKADSPAVATKWLNHIHQAQNYYIEAVERRNQQWKLLQSLQTDRILDGIGLEGALSASLLSLSSSRLELNKCSFSSMNSLTIKRQSSPTVRPVLKKNPLVRTRSEEQTRRLLAQKFCEQSSELIQAAAAAKMRAGSLDLLLEQPETPVRLRASPSQARLAISQPSVFLLQPGSQDSLTSSLQQIPTSPLSQDSGTESGETISTDILDLTTKGLQSTHTQDNSMPLKTDSSPLSIVKIDSPKSILRHQNKENEQLEALRPILRQQTPPQLDVPTKPLNRVKSVDSGIAVKTQGVSDSQESDNYSPSPVSRTSVPSNSRTKMKVHFRSQSDTSTLSLDIFSPVTEGNVGSALSGGAIPLVSPTILDSSMPSCSSPIPIPSPSPVQSISLDSNSKPPTEVKSNSQTLKHKLSQAQAEVTTPSPTARPPKQPPPVPKKRVQRQSPATKTADKSTSIRKKSVGGRQVKNSPSTTQNKTLSTQVGQRRPSQIQQPSIVGEEICSISVKDVARKYETACADKSPQTRKECKTPSRKMSQPPKTPPRTLRKISQPPKTPPRPTYATHNRSKSYHDQSHFHRQGAVRVAKPSSPKTQAKKSVTQQQSNNLARRASAIPKERPSFSTTRKPSSFDEPKTDGTMRQDKETLSKLAALTPHSKKAASVSKLPQRVSVVDTLSSPDTRIRIEVVGRERGIDIPPNSNSNNNNEMHEPKLARKPSTYKVLDAVTVKSQEERLSTMQHMYKRFPMEWNRFGFSRKNQYNCTLRPSKTFTQQCCQSTLS